MRTATGQASTSIHFGATSSPILLRSPVNRTSGNTANGSCRLRMTWLRIEQLPGAALAVEIDGDQGRDDRDQPRDQPPQPGPQPDVEEAFHHDLPRQRPGQRGVLPREQQRDGEQRARERRARAAARAAGRRREMSATSSWPLPWNAAAAMTRIAPLRNSAVISATVESIVANRTASRLLADVVEILARLHDRRVQVQVVRHHGRAEDADRDVEHLRVAHDLGRWQQPARARRRGRAAPGPVRPKNEPAMPTISSTTSAST